MSVDDLHEGDGDATDLAPEERVGLIPTWIATRAELNRAEQQNIARGARWARGRRREVLDEAYLLTLHRRMFGEVWRWAGEMRRTEKNIGVREWWRLPEQLQMLLGDVRAQVEHRGRAPDELAVDFHHRLVALHLFPNGNGRHARLAADLLIEQLGGASFSWGRANLVDAGDMRRAYVEALRAADAGDGGLLVAFARS